MGGSFKEEDQELFFEPDWSSVENAVVINAGYVDIKNYITDNEIEEINRETGIPDLVCVPRELGGGFNGENILIDIAIGLASATMYDALKYSLKKIFEKIKSKMMKKKIECGKMIFRFGDENSSVRVDLSVDLNGSKEQIDKVVNTIESIAKLIDENK
ncbi:MAG: hypothetical protein MJ125_03370 [Clostridia bacterium]|nr:hypothetical protein [Clostridia bacterium]